VAAPVDGAVTVNVTGTVFVVAPVAATVIVALKVPAARPAVLTLTVATPGPEPEAGLTVSQGALSLVDQLRVPLPVFVILRDWAPRVRSAHAPGEGQTGRAKPDGWICGRCCQGEHDRHPCSHSATANHRHTLTSTLAKSSGIGRVCDGGRSTRRHRYRVTRRAAEPIDRVVPGDGQRIVPVLVTVTPCVWLGPSTVPVYTKGDGETIKPAEASDWSAIVKAATRTRQTAHTKIAFVLKRPACTLCFRIHVSTVMTL